MNKDPLSWLDTKHPHYTNTNTMERAQRWRAILEGMEDLETKKKFLPKTEVELLADYEFRIKIAEFMGSTGPAIERLTGAIFGVPAKIDAGNDVVQRFVDDCNGSGTKLVDFFESVSPQAQGMGISFVGIDKIETNKTFVTRRQEIDSGTLRCFATQYAFEEVTNWAMDIDGMPSWVIISRLISRQPSQNAEVEWVQERRMMTRTDTVIWEKAANEKGQPLKADEHYRFVKSTRHDLGVVPIVPVYGIFVDHFRGRPILAGTMKADIARFNEETWGTVDRYRHANQLLALKSSREITEIVKGGAFRLDEGEDLKYVSPDSTAFEARETAITRLKREGVSQSGTNPAETSDGPNSTSGESGIAQLVRFTHTEKRAIEKHAGSIEVAMTTVIMIAGKLLGVPDVVPKVSLFTSFDSLDLEEESRGYERMQYWIRSRRWHLEKLKAMALKSLPDADQSTRDEIVKEVEADAKTIVPAQPPQEITNRAA